MKVLAVFDKDWADEFQCQQFRILDVETTDEACDLIERTWDMHDGEICFGTNEGFEKEELRIDRDVKFILISEEEASTIKRFLGDSFGTGIL